MKNALRLASILPPEPFVVEQRKTVQVFYSRLLSKSKNSPDLDVSLHTSSRIHATQLVTAECWKNAGLIWFESLRLIMSALFWYRGAFFRISRQFRLSRKHWKISLQFSKWSWSKYLLPTTLCFIWIYYGPLIFTENNFKKIPFAIFLWRFYAMVSFFTFFYATMLMLFLFHTTVTFFTRLYAICHPQRKIFSIRG